MKKEKTEKKERVRKERPSRGERRLKKGKIMLAGIIVVVLIIAIIVGIVLFINRKGKENPEDNPSIEEELSRIVELPETTYSDMKVTDINMQVLEDNNETMISMIITNTTENTVEQEDLTAILIDEKGESLAQMPTYIDHLAPGEQYSISVILKGDLTSTAQILLQKEDAQQPAQPETPEQ